MEMGLEAGEMKKSDLNRCGSNDSITTIFPTLNSLYRRGQL
jgi:hypothetical protein